MGLRKIDIILSCSERGHHYSTTRETLILRAPESMLAAMFSGRHHQPLDENGEVFIDRDGVRFRHILNYLRTGETRCDPALS